MKKLYLLIFISLLILTGCGKKTVVCTGTYEEEGIKAKTTVTGYLDKEDKITNADINYDLSDAELTESLCSYLMVLNKIYDVEVKCDKTNVLIKNYIGLLSEEEQKDLVGITKAGFIETMEMDNFKCK